MDDRIFAKAERVRWLEWPGLPEDMRAELLALKDDEEALAERFGRHLSFGTGGLRGLLGAGTNRMNLLTVRRAARGLAEYVKESGGASVCIAWDTRMMSREFAREAAQTLCGAGVCVHLFSEARPTPMLSFAVREKRAFAGIVITASHNPREYNGFKVYGASGGQITERAARTIYACMSRCDVLCGDAGVSLDDAREKGMLFDLGGVDARYYEKVRSLILRKELLRQRAHELRVLYTPLHGSGNVPVRRVLGDLGFASLFAVPEQEAPDGRFPTAPTPNPEEPAVFALALERAKDCRPDLILATDPDCDRIGVMARNQRGAYALLSGNQMGALLCETIIAAKKESGTLEANAAVVKTIVTTDLARLICEREGVALFETLTGFKYIGEKIEEWQESGEYSFLFGFEESFGYLAGDFVRDKDAVIAAALICETALYYKINGMTLWDALEALYKKHAHCGERLKTVTMEGREGAKKMRALVERFRNDPESILPEGSVLAAEDYLSGVRTDWGTQARARLALPQSDVMKFFLRGERTLAVRPSGTEPKLKFYLGAFGESKDSVEEKLNELEMLVRGLEVEKSCAKNA